MFSMGDAAPGHGLLTSSILTHQHQTARAMHSTQLLYCALFSVFTLVPFFLNKKERNIRNTRLGKRLKSYVRGNQSSQSLSSWLNAMVTKVHHRKIVFKICYRKIFIHYKATSDYYLLKRFCLYCLLKELYSTFLRLRRTDY